ncbi:MAG TPA: ATP-binding protein [Roseiflexaceae bacterium]|nr:ATP-binding protein [Roseiflexaceae bacterium]
MSDHADKPADTGLATAFSLGPVILTITRLADGRFVEVNERFIAATGYTRAEVLGRTPLEIGLWINPDQRADGLRRLREGQPVREIEAEFRMKNGEQRTCLMSADLIELHGEPCALTALTDITERKQVEAILARYHLLSERTRDIMLFIRPDGQIVEANASAVTAYGEDRATLLTKNIRDLCAPTEAARFAAQLAQVDAQGKLFTTTHRRSDGTTFLAEVSLIGAEIGGQPLLLSIIRDITEREQAEAERTKLLQLEQAARAAAEAAVQVRDTFLSTAAHELKTPLTVLLGNVQLLQRRLTQAAVPERDERLLQTIGEQAARLNRLIAVMLDLSRLQSDQLTITRAPLDIVALVRRVADDVRPTLILHTLTCCLPDTPVLIEGDELRLEQVLQNLLSNAVKYSPNGGPISVQIERRGGAVRVSVADQGIGIPQANLSRLFQRFYRADNVDQRQISGMGIGLYVVRAIVELHGGRVDVVSPETGGSIFTISLPAIAD